MKGSKAAFEAKRKKRAAFITIIIAVVLVSSTFAFVLSGSNALSVLYSGIRFVQKSDNYWYAKVAGEQYKFYSSPEVFSAISIPEGAIKKVYDTKQAYLLFNASSDSAYLSAVEGVVFELQEESLPEIIFGRAITENSSIYPLPVVSCANSTIPIIKFERGNETKMFYEENCLVAMSYSQYDILIIKDRILFEILKMKAKK